MYVMYCLSLTGHLFMILHIVLMILIYWPTFNFKFGQDIPGKKKKIDKINHFTITINMKGFGWHSGIFTET